MKDFTSSKDSENAAMSFGAAFSEWWLTRSLETKSADATNARSESADSDMGLLDDLDIATAYSNWLKMSDVKNCSAVDFKFSDRKVDMQDIVHTTNP